jgi:hypothetical protein
LVARVSSYDRSTLGPANELQQRFGAAGNITRCVEGGMNDAADCMLGRRGTVTRPPDGVPIDVRGLHAGFVAGCDRSPVGHEMLDELAKVNRRVRTGRAEPAPIGMVHDRSVIHPLRCDLRHSRGPRIRAQVVVL